MTAEAQFNGNEKGDESKVKVDINKNFVDLKMDTLEAEAPSLAHIHPIHDLLYEAYRVTIWLWPYAFVIGMPIFFFTL